MNKRIVFNGSFGEYLAKKTISDLLLKSEDDPCNLCQEIPSILCQGKIIILDNAQYYQLRSVINQKVFLPNTTTIISKALAIMSLSRPYNYNTFVDWTYRVKTRNDLLNIEENEEIFVPPLVFYKAHDDKLVFASWWMEITPSVDDAEKGYKDEWINYALDIVLFRENSLDTLKYLRILPKLRVKPRFLKIFTDNQETLVNSLIYTCNYKKSLEEQKRLSNEIWKEIKSRGQFKRKRITAELKDILPTIRQVSRKPQVKRKKQHTDTCLLCAKSIPLDKRGYYCAGCYKKRWIAQLFVNALGWLHMVEAFKNGDLTSEDKEKIFLEIRRTVKQYTYKYYVKCFYNVVKKYKRLNWPDKDFHENLLQKNILD